MKINFNNFAHLDLFTVFQKSVPPKFNKCKKCGRILKSHSKRFCGLRCSDTSVVLLCDVLRPIGLS